MTLALLSESRRCPPESAGNSIGLALLIEPCLHPSDLPGRRDGTSRSTPMKSCPRTRGANLHGRRINGRPAPSLWLLSLHSIASKPCGP